MKRPLSMSISLLILAACQTPQPTAAPSPTTRPIVAQPTTAPTIAMTTAPVATPTSAPTTAPTAAPTQAPTTAPTTAPTITPTATLTQTPSTAPTSTPTVAPTAEPPAPSDVVVNADNGLNLRAEANAAATLLRTLAAGTHLVAIGQPTTPDANSIVWQNVRTDDGQTGWVAAQFLTNAGSPTATATPTPAPVGPPGTQPIAKPGYVYVASTDGLNLRAASNVSSQLLAMLANGQRLKTNGLGFGPDSFGITWLNVETENGVQGWVAAQFISDQVPSVAPAAPPMNESGIAAEILRRTNEFRQQHSLPPLILNDDLSRLALVHSAYMSQAGNTHLSADGLTAKQRIANAGYGAGWPVENVYYSYGSGALDDAWKFWTTDPDHLKNLLTDRNTVLGVGVYKAGQMVFMTQDFGKPAQ